MGYNPGSSTQESSEQERKLKRQLQLDPETIKRIEYALEGTLDVDISSLSLDDKLTLLIERYNRKVREMEQYEEGK